VFESAAEFFDGISDADLAIRANLMGCAVPLGVPGPWVLSRVLPSGKPEGRVRPVPKRGGYPKPWGLTCLHGVQTDQNTEGGLSVQRSPGRVGRGGGGRSLDSRARRCPVEMEYCYNLSDEDGCQARIGLYPIVTFQYSSTTSYQVSYHMQ
jgi:hypothetical protein